MFSNQEAKVWKKDEPNFGRRLMRKFGCNKHFGLRKKSAAVTEPVRPAQAHNKEGLGYGNSRWDYSWNWLSHQDDYTVLLSQLQQQHLTPSENKPSVNLDSESAIHSVTDLEKKAKKSRKRILYQRNIQGKNMKNCSEADWNCILGIKRRKKMPEEPDSTVEVEECQDQPVIFSAAAGDSLSDRFQAEGRSDETATSEVFLSQGEPENDIPTTATGDSMAGNEQQIVQINGCSQLGKKRKKKRNKKKNKLLKQECFKLKSTSDETLVAAECERVKKENNCQAEDSLIVLRKARKIKKRKKRSELKTILDVTNLGLSQFSETSSLENECITGSSTCRGILKTSSGVGENTKPAQKKSVTFLDKPIVGFVPAKDSVRGGAWLWRTKNKTGKSIIV